MSVGSNENMSETKFTPGPWDVWEGWTYVGGGADLCIGRGEDWLANMNHRLPRCPQIMENGHHGDDCDICMIDSGDITAEQRANAFLIAAAPDLLEALKEIIATCPAVPDRTSSFLAANDKARAAIAKAITVRPVPAEDDDLAVADKTDLAKIVVQSGDVV